MKTMANRNVIFRSLMVFAVLGILSCSAAQSIARGVSSVSGVMTRATAGGELTGTETILVTAMTMLTSIFNGGSRFNDQLIATAEALALEDMLIARGPVLALYTLCSAPFLDELPPAGIVVEEIVNDEGNELAVLTMSGPLAESELFAALDITVESQGERASVVIRGGAWLLCALVEGNIEVDGEPLLLTDDEGATPSLELETSSIELPDGGEPQIAVMATITYILNVEVVQHILAADELIFRFGDAVVAYYPAETSEIQRYLGFLQPHHTPESIPSSDPESIQAPTSTSTVDAASELAPE